MLHCALCFVASQRNARIDSSDDWSQQRRTDHGSPFMPPAIASFPERLLVALLCVQISIGGAGAAEVSAAAIFARKSSQEPQRTQNGPSFQPPSAANCARPVQTA